MRKPFLVDVRNETKTPILLPQVRKLIKAAILLVPASKRRQSSRHHSVSVLFTNDRFMRKLNARYRGKDKPTDVLSFELGSDIVLGEIVVAIPYSRRQAKRENLSFDTELANLLVHGLLHLLGFDHEGVSRKKAKEMFDLQDRIAFKVKRKLVCCCKSTNGEGSERKNGRPRP